MQKLKIYAQKTENGGLDYYTNLYHKDKDTEKVKFQKLRVGFKKDCNIRKCHGITFERISKKQFNKIKRYLNPD